MVASGGEGACVGVPACMPVTVSPAGGWGWGTAGADSAGKGPVGERGGMAPCGAWNGGWAAEEDCGDGAGSGGFVDMVASGGEGACVGVPACMPVTVSPAGGWGWGTAGADSAG